MFDRLIKKVVLVLGVLVCLYTLVAVNYAVLQPQSSLAIFVGIGLVLCYLEYPLDKRWKDVQWLRYVDVGLALLSAACFGYIFVQTEPWWIFQQFWAGGESLGSRASQETTLDFGSGSPACSSSSKQRGGALVGSFPP